MTNWIVRIGDTKNFFNTFEGLNVWSVNSFYTKFLENVKENDKLFFVGNKSKCKICAFAIFKSFEIRTSKTPTNEQYGWIFHGPNDNGKWKNSKWDYIMFYTNYVDFRNIQGVNLNTNINIQHCHAIMPRSIIDASGFNFDNVIVFAENYKICKFLEEIR